MENDSFRFEGLVKAGALFFAVLLAVLSVSSLRLLSRTRDYLERDLEKRLVNLSEIVSHEIEGRYDDALRDPYYLYAVSVKESLNGMALLDPQGMVVVDTTEKHKKGERYVMPWITPGEYSGVWRGRTVVSPPYKRDGGTVRSVCFPQKDGEGRIAAAGVLTLDAGYIDDLTQQGTAYFLFKTLAAVFLLLVFLYVIRSLVLSQRRILQTARGVGLDHYDAGDNVSFVVNTFHQMVGQLKEKERELKELKEKAEEKARSIESYNENVLANITSGVMTFDMGGRVITANHASGAILGRGPESMTGKPAGDIFGEGGWVSGLIDRTIAEGRPARRGEGEVRTLDGRARWLGAGVSPLLGSDDVLQGAILVFTDLTEVRQLRERMELKERMTALGEMSAGIAHELRNPMGVIAGYAELLSRRLKDDEASREAVGSIQAEVKVMDEIIREFMNFSQPTELNITTVDVKPLIGESIRALSGMAGGVVRDTDIPEGLPPVEGDAVLLRQAFVNIVKNALEATPDGGRLRVAASVTGSGSAEIGLPGGAYIRVDVSDTGSGIAEADIRNIFTPFFTTKGKGTGLGLALVQKILVYHGGRALVKSAVGKGTTFSVYLPVKSVGGGISDGT